MTGNVYEERITFLFTYSLTYKECSKHTYFTLLMSSKLKVVSFLTCDFVGKKKKKKEKLAEKIWLPSSVGSFIFYVIIPHLNRA